MIVKYSSCKKRKIEGNFKGGSVTSDSGALLLREADRALGLSKAVSRIMTDKRRKKSCLHSVLELLKQRVYSVALGYEDLNDHQELRGDICFQTAVGKAEELASTSTLCRFENSADSELAWSIHEVMIDKFIASYEKAPDELILDFDATDDRVHGNQEGRFFHGFYNSYCFLPLYVFCGNQQLVGYLRRSNQDAAKHSGAILRLLVKRLRQAWPDVRIVFRADSGFCRWRTLSWCERNGVEYVVGIAKNKRLIRYANDFILKAQEAFTESGEKQRLFSTFQYAAGTWNRERKIIVKAEHSEYGSNPRFVISNLQEKPQKLYDNIYCARGEMENRIKESQLQLFADRTSCHNWWPNQFRLLISSLAYTLVEYIRRNALVGTQLAKAQVNTIRLKLFKIGAVVIKNTKAVRISMSSYYPYQTLYAQVAQKLTAT